MADKWKNVGEKTEKMPANIICQKQCQEKMPENMSQKMPKDMLEKRSDKMLEKMSDRMSGDMSERFGQNTKR